MIKSQELADPQSCLNRARSDEMLFVLLGRDPAVPGAIRAWVVERIRLGKNQPNDPQILDAVQIAASIESSQFYGFGEPLSPELISFGEAIQRLPATEDVHTFRQVGTSLIGATWHRAEIVGALRRAPRIEVTGPHAQVMGHGLAIEDDQGWLFIETARFATG